MRNLFSSVVGRLFKLRSMLPTAQEAGYGEWVGARRPKEVNWEIDRYGADGRLLPWGNETGVNLGL